MKKNCWDCDKLKVCKFFEILLNNEFTRIMSDGLGKFAELCDQFEKRGDD
ncbi:MAG: hypothetical protein ACXQS8_06455 [Candidatus Helarchaeales archaeon]